VVKRLTIRKGDLYTSPPGFAIATVKGGDARWYVWDLRPGSREPLLEMRPMMGVSTEEHVFVTLSRLLATWTRAEPNPKGTPVWTEPEAARA
jgi:hypothetical protein